MRIDCPTCKAAYDVPPERLAAGRAVKCSRCATMWAPMPLDAAPMGESPVEAPAVESAALASDPPPAPDAAPVEATEPEPTVQPDPVRPAPAVVAAPEVPPPSATPPDISKLEPLAPPVPSRRSRAPLVLAWLLTIAVLAGLGWAAVDRRAAIMKAWPPSIRAYLAIGLAAPADDAPVTKP